MNSKISKRMKEHLIAICCCILLASPLTMAETDAKAILQFSTQLMYMNRMDITCNGKLNRNDLSKYYSNDFMKRISKSCEESRLHGITGSLISTASLDGISPSLCWDDQSASSACYKDYTVTQIHSQDDKAEVKITYNSGEFFYTVLKLIHEDSQWRLDDISLIDPKTKGTDYDESIYSIKSEIDKEIARLEKKKKVNFLKLK